MTNNLPKKWLVKNDGSSRFKRVVLPYFNSKAKLTYAGTQTGSYCYYGKLTRYDNYTWSTARDSGATILTIDEFESLLNPFYEIY